MCILRGNGGRRRYHLGNVHFPKGICQPEETPIAPNNRKTAKARFAGPCFYVGGVTKTSQSKHFAEVKRMVHDYPRQQELLLRNNNIQQPSHSQGRPEINQTVDTPRRGFLHLFLGGAMPGQYKIMEITLSQASRPTTSSNHICMEPRLRMMLQTMT